MEDNKTNSVVLQKLKRKDDSSFSKAMRYYNILSAVNDLGLTKRELQLVAFTAIKGNISYASNRKEFCEKYNTTGASINNIVSKLKKMKVLVKDGSKVKVNPVITLDFTKEIHLEIKLLENG